MTDTIASQNINLPSESPCIMCGNIYWWNVHRTVRIRAGSNGRSSIALFAVRTEWNSYCTVNMCSHRYCYWHGSSYDAVHFSECSTKLGTDCTWSTMFHLYFESL